MTQNSGVTKDDFYLNVKSQENYTNLRKSHPVSYSRESIAKPYWTFLKIEIYLSHYKNKLRKNFFMQAD